MTFPALPVRPSCGVRDRGTGKDRPKGGAGILPSCAQRFPKLVFRVRRASETGAQDQRVGRKR